MSLFLVAILVFLFCVVIGVFEPCSFDHLFLNSRFCPVCQFESYEVCDCGQRINPAVPYCSSCGRSHDSDG